MPREPRKDFAGFPGATDALCSVNDTTHDALLLLYRARFSQQIATATCEEILRAWDC